MIPASLYQTLYLLIVLFFTIRTILAYTNSTIWNIKRTNTAQNRLTLFLTVFLIVFIGFRPVSGAYFVDMINYEDFYIAAYNGTFIYTLTNYIWDPLFVLMAVSGIPVDIFFATVAAIYFGGIYIACKKMFPRDTLLSFLVYLAGFSTFSYGTNGIKAGAAASLFLIMLAYKDKWKVSIFFILLIFGIHHAMIVPIVAFVVAKFVTDRRLFLLFWLFCFVLAALHITFFMSLFARFTDEGGASYLQGGTDDPAAMVSGFRPDLIMYSAIPIFLGDYLIRKYKIKSNTYVFLWNVYTLSNSVFLLCTYGTYINRIAYLSWLMYPIVLLYPFLNILWSKQQAKYLKYAVWGHLGFTLFMMLIYYA